MSSYLSPQFKYWIFHTFICILHHLQVYYELTMWPAPRSLYSSVDRALHQYRRGHGFESCSGLIFFQALILQLLKLCAIAAMINHAFIFLLTGNKLGPFEKPFLKLGLRVSPGFPKTIKLENNKSRHSAFSLVLSSVFSCLESLMKHSPSVMKYYFKRV